MRIPPQQILGEQMKRMMDAVHLERKVQFNIDRNECLEALSNVGEKSCCDMWRVFCLRWNLSMPPTGWKDYRTILTVMHTSRLSIDLYTYEQHLESALWLQTRNIPLPGSMMIIDGQLTGKASDVKRSIIKP
jgi:hypothetical protein